MGIAITQEQRDLAESVREFTARHAPSARTRAGLADLSAGLLPAVWEAVKAQGYLGIHLPESAGGDGGGITEVAVLLAEAGLVSPHYPRPYGLAADAASQVIISQEFQRAGMTQPGTVVGEWALPTILAHGTDEQRERFAMPTLRGDIGLPLG
jgi:alkylation response protein AidB-like acyl-CoA dehydrogenase